jgi:hypothetical protein
MAMAPTEKCVAAFKIISDASRYDMLLASTNFPNFLITFIQSIGGDEIQRALINNQLNQALDQVKILNNSTVAGIRKIVSVSEHLGIVKTSFKAYFWNAYSKYTKDSIEVYKSDIEFTGFYLAMSQLIEFDAVLTDVGADENDHQMVTFEMMSLVSVQINELLKHANAWSAKYTRSESSGLPWLHYYDDKKGWIRVNQNGSQYSRNEATSKENPPQNNALHWNHVGIGSWRNKYTNEMKKSVNNPVSGRTAWYDLSLADFKTAFESILLLSYHETFCMNFGPEKVQMDSFLRRYESNRLACCNLLNHAMAGIYNDDGQFILKSKDLYDIFVHFEMPKLISDPDHWGHLTWMFCKFMDSKRSWTATG